MFNFGAFAGGLAEGARSGQNMALRQKQGERAAQADEREAEDGRDQRPTAGADNHPAYTDVPPRLAHARYSISVGHTPRYIPFSAA